MSGYRTRLLPVVVATLSLFPIQILAAQLGKLEILSAAGEPFKATVQIEGVEPGQMASLQAGLAQSDAFQAARLVFDPKLSVLQFTIEPTNDPTRSVLKLSSQQPIDAGFLDALIELKWAGGQVVREYTLVIPAAQGASPTSPVASATRPAPQLPVTVQSPAQQSGQPVPSSPASSQSTPTVDPQVQPNAQPQESSLSALQNQVQVKSGQTLSEIAQQFVDDTITLNQAMAAIYDNNQGAFFGQSVHNLKVNATLILPNKTAILSRNPKEALLILANNDDRNVYSSYARSIGLLAQVPAQQTDSAGASGTTVVGKIEQTPTQPAAPAEMVDQLRIGSGGQEAANNQADAMDDLMAEELLAKSKALEEANERIALLEKNINDLQKLLEMQEANQQAPIQPEGLSEQLEGPEQTTSELLPEVQVDHSLLPASPNESESVKSSNDPVEEAPKTSDSDLAKPIPAGASEWSWGQFFTSPLTFGLIGVLVALVMVLVFSRYRSQKKGNSESPWSGDKKDAKNSAESFDEALAVVTKEVKTKVDQQPVQDARMSEVEQEIEVEEMTPPAAANRKTARLEPQAVVPEVLPASKLASQQSNALDADVELDFSVENAKEEADQTNSDFLRELESMDQAAENAQKELDSLKDQQSSSSQEFQATDKPLSEQAVDADLANSDDNVPVSKSVEPISEPILELDIPEGNDPDEAVWHEVATKLDLASAYVEIGDADGAKELLNEIIAKGDGEQVKKAKELLNSLG